jgi:division protein CdvB (Snf7/Vps24/ESCRT-III family)
MTIGATEGKEPDHISDEDIQMLSLDDMRGAYQDMHKAKLSLNEKATVEGVMTEISVLKQQLEMTHEQMRRLIGMYATLQDEFTQYKQQRIAELHMKVNNGSTTFEDEE